MLLIVSLFCVGYFQADKTHSLQWYEQLVSDSALTNSSAMSASEIKSFLQAKGSYLANYTIPSKDYSSNCPTQEGAGQKAYDFIHNVAHDVGINPQIILVTMQKEESLITLSNPNTVRLQWAMGYGYYSGSPLINKNNCDLYVGGFGRQVYWSAKFMKNRYNNVGGYQGPGSSHKGDTINITTRSWQAGTTRVYLSNRSTALLYRYTPYIYNGNYNFYTLMKRWFAGGTQSAAYNYGKVPNTKLRKYGSTYYLVYGSWRYSLGTNDSVLKKYGYSTAEATSTTVMSAQTYGDLTNKGILTDYIKGSSASTYLIVNGLRFLVNSSNNFKARWGLDGKTPTTISDDFLYNIYEAPYPLSGLIRATNSSEYYFIDGGKRYYVYHNSIYWKKWGLSLNDVRVMPKTFIDSLRGAGQLSHIAVDESNRYYLVDRLGSRTVKYPISKAKSVWDKWGINKLTDKGYTNETINSIATIKNLSNTIRALGVNRRYYYVDNYGSRYLISASVWKNWKFDKNDTVYISNAQFWMMPSGGSLQNHVRRGNDQKQVCKMTNGICKSAKPISRMSILAPASYDALRKK